MRDATANVCGASKNTIQSLQIADEMRVMFNFEAAKAPSKLQCACPDVERYQHVLA